MKQQKNIQYVSTQDAPAAIGPYSQAVKSDNLLFVSGQLPIDPSTGEFVDGGIKDKTHRVIKNIEAIAKTAGSDLSHVVKTTLFLTDMNCYADVNDVYAQYFKEALPARAVVQVAGLPKNADIEMEAILNLADNHHEI